MPWERAARPQLGQDATDPSRPSGQACLEGDLAIGREMTGGDVIQNRQYSLLPAVGGVDHEGSIPGGM